MPPSSASSFHACRKGRLHIRTSYLRLIFGTIIFDQIGRDAVFGGLTYTWGNLYTRIYIYSISVTTSANQTVNQSINQIEHL